MNENSWKRLDNAALIFPAASNNANTYVFRVSCQLFENIDEELLSRALKQTLTHFPIMRSVLKRGFFWYYLEESSLEPKVCREHLPLCSPLMLKEIKSLLFRVTYYKRRINVEMHHILADGSGAVEFLKLLVQHYLLEKIPALQKNKQLPQYDASLQEREDDSFHKYYSGVSKPEKKNKRVTAYRIKGAKNPENRLGVIEGVMPVDKTVDTAHLYGATLTAFLCAILIYAIYEDMNVRALKKPVIVTVPVNLRRFFPSRTVRNFFSIIKAGYKFDNKSVSFEKVTEKVKRDFESELSLDKLSERLDRLAGFESNILARISPLGLKDIVLSAIYKHAAKGNTSNISNIGKIVMPDAVKDYIDYFDVFTSSTKLQICACSYENNLTVSFAGEFVSSEIQKNFFRRLSDFGIPIEINASFSDNGRTYEEV